MYFWRIEALKRELRQGPLSARRSLPYVAAWFVFLSLGPVVMGVTDDASWVWPVMLGTYAAVASILGAWWSYRANGGIHGVDFTTRALSIWWVLGIRFIVFLAIPIVVLYAILTPSEGAEVRTPYVADMVSSFFFTVPFYWRAAVHLRDVAQGAPETV